MPNHKILVVDDDADMRWALARVFKRSGYECIDADDVQPAMNLFESELPDAVILDVQLPGGSGLDVLKEIHARRPEIPVVMITGYGSTDLAVEAMKTGAYNFIEKPFKSNDQILLTVNRALEERRLKAENEQLRSELGAIKELSALMGHSDEIKAVIKQVNSVADTDFTVVLYGETGSGKELVARAIHAHSRRRDHEFVAVDCGSIPETLIESELFGHEKGAFTGAVRAKEGYFELAAGGTLFLDEIGNLPIAMQSKLLRSIEMRTIRRLGGKRPIEVDIRILAAGNRRLEELVQSGDFRQDLYYRLTEFTIEIPPLRERKDDILYLTKRFMDATNQELNKNVRDISPDALREIENYDWPGNVRELRNVIRRAVLLADDRIERSHLVGIQKTRLDGAQGNDGFPSGIRLDYDIDSEDFSLKSAVKSVIGQVERQILADVLERTGGNKSKASRILKIDYKTMHYKLKEYGLGGKE